MQIQLNGKPQEVTDGLNLAELVVELGLGQRRIAIELNEDLIPRSEHQQHHLNVGDRVEIITAVGGG